MMKGLGLEIEIGEMQIEGQRLQKTFHLYF